MSPDPDRTSGRSRRRRGPGRVWPAVEAGLRSASVGAVLVAGVALTGCAGAAAAPTASPPAPELAADPQADAMLAASGAAALGLVSMTSDEARRRLGPPGLQRREKWAEFWRYRLERCVLDLYLYEEAADRRRVLYAELRRDRRPARPDDCHGSVLHIGGRGA